MQKKFWTGLKHIQIKYLYWLSLCVAMCVNLVLAIFIEYQKRASQNNTGFITSCFADINAGGCGTVASSVYATTFGVSNPWYGIFFFSFLLIVSILEIRAIFYKSHTKTILFFILRYVQTYGMILATIFALWLLYVQFFILYAICTYCLWVDGITITWTIAYFVLRTKILYE